MEHIYLLSYGSNMLFDRIYERITSVQVTGAHKLNGYQLAFNKQSADGSTKANIVATENLNDYVHGVVHKIHHTDLLILNDYERGYDLEHVDVSTDTFNNKLYAYVATDEFIAPGKPYDWYLNLVIAGALENQLPPVYVNQLKTIRHKIDVNTDRSKKNHRLASIQSIDSQKRIIVK